MMYNILQVNCTRAVNEMLRQAPLFKESNVFAKSLFNQFLQ